MSAPTSSHTARWRAELDRLEEKGLDRALEVVGPDDPAIDLASNDYLGLAGDERLAEAAAEAARREGVGAGASRLVTGNRPAHEALEETIAAYKGAGRALLFSSGYAANVGVLSALAGPRDRIYADRLSHASLIDGARQSGARFRMYRHGELEHLRTMMASDAAGGSDRGTAYVVTDGVFSMDGDLAPLPDLADLCDERGAVLIVDDAHGTGVAGPEGRGSVAHFGLEDRVPVRVATLSKALGTQGGVVLGEAPLIELLVNRARSFIYSTAIAPPVAAAARRAVELAREADGRRERLREHLQMLREGCEARGYRVLGEDPAPMVAVLVGEPAPTLRLAERLAEAGIRAPAIRPPTVPEGTSRIRLAPKATHERSALEETLEAFPPADLLLGG